MGLKAFLSNVHNSYVIDFKVEKHIKTWSHKNSFKKTESCRKRLINDGDRSCKYQDEQADSYVISWRQFPSHEA